MKSEVTLRVDIILIRHPHLPPGIKENEDVKIEMEGN